MVKSFHRQLNEAFQFSRLVFINCVSKVLRSQARCTLKLTWYEPNDYNNEELLGEHIEWCQKFLEINGNMVDVVHMDEGGLSLHLTC